MTMTRHHFEALAAAIATIADEGERNSVASLIGDVCAASNARFDRTRFYQACDVIDESQVYTSRRNIDVAANMLDRQ